MKGWSLIASRPNYTDITFFNTSSKALQQPWTLLPTEHRCKASETSNYKFVELYLHVPLRQYIVVTGNIIGPISVFILDMAVSGIKHSKCNKRRDSKIEMFNINSTARHRTQSWDSSIHLQPQIISLRTILILSPHLYVDIPSGRIPRRFSIKILYNFLIYTFWGTCRLSL
jgi:hypothetical protein